ncbi:hypothetical protein MRX96_027045 [Rhipicephalus microplus]
MQRAHAVSGIDALLAFVVCTYPAVWRDWQTHLQALYVAGSSPRDGALEVIYAIHRRDADVAKEQEARGLASSATSGRNPMVWLESK